MHILTSLVAALVLAGPPAQTTGKLTWSDDAVPLDLGRRLTSRVYVRLTDRKAKGLVSPDAKTARMGGFAVALDAAKPGEKELTVLRIVAAEELDFTRADAIPLARALQVNQSFAIPARTVKPLPGRDDIRSVVGGHIRRYARTYAASLTISTAAAGKCLFGDKVLPVQLLDGTRNARVGDPVAPVRIGPHVGDVARIDTDADGAYELEVFVGQPVRIGGRWYTVGVEDGKVVAERVDVEAGELTGPGSAFLAWLVGDGTSLLVRGEGETAMPVPAGTYSVIAFEQYGPADGKRGGARLEVGHVGGQAAEITLKAEEETELGRGTPLQGSVSSRTRRSRGRREVRLSLRLTDAGGATVRSLTASNGNRPPAPTVDVVDDEGRSVHQATLRYG